MLIEWQEAWLLGEDRIDAEHLALVATINALYAAAEHAEGREGIFALLLELVERTKRHFAYEEQLMESHEYPGIAPHRQQHRKLLSVVDDVMQNVSGLDSEVLLRSVGTFDEWFIAHVETDDLALGRFLVARG